MGSTPSISVITATYNRRDAVLRAVKSVSEQDLASFQHIVVDDGSNDGTFEALSELHDSRLIVIRLPARKGANFARNVGLAASRADIVTFLDSDDIFLRSRLSSALKRFDNDPGLELMVSSFTTIRGSKKAVCVNRECRLDGPKFEMALAEQAVFIAGSAITARRKALLEVGAFDPSIQRMQDRELLLRFAGRFGVQLSRPIDWIKYSSQDSISQQPRGYFEAYSRLLSKHPHISERYPDAVRYLMASRLLRSLTKGDFAEAMAGYRVNRSSPLLRHSLSQLASSLIVHRRKRRLLRASLRLDARCSDTRDAGIG